MTSRRSFVGMALGASAAAAAGGMGVALPVFGTPAQAQSEPSRMARPPYLFGLHVPDGNRVVELPRAEQAAGRKADVVLVFNRLDTPSSHGIVELQRQGYEVVLCLEWWDRSKQQRDPRFSLQEIVAGTHDAAADVWWRLLAELPAPIHLRPMHEGNGNWYPWAAYNGVNHPSQYVGAFRHVADSAWAVAGRQKIRMQWCVNRSSLTPTPAPITSLYPGDDYVDEFAVNGYDRPEAHSTIPFAEIFGPAHRELKALSADRPFWIGETASTETRGDKAVWIEAMFHTLRTSMVIDVLTWFNEAVQPSGQPARDWPFDTSPASLEAFRHGIQVTRGV